MLNGRVGSAMFAARRWRGKQKPDLESDQRYNLRLQFACREDRPS
jgi:hypothetical protein